MRRINKKLKEKEYRAIDIIDKLSQQKSIVPQVRVFANNSTLTTIMRKCYVIAPSIRRGEKFGFESAETADMISFNFKELRFDTEDIDVDSGRIILSKEGLGIILEWKRGIPSKVLGE